MKTLENHIHLPKLHHENSLFSFSEFFGNEHPVEVDIGCGKGSFLAALAAQFREVNFLGVDRAPRWLRKGRLSHDRAKLENLRFIRAEARTFVKDCIPQASVTTFYVFFPDPWPKRKHHRRRLIEPDFLSTLHQGLKPGGLIELATDDFDYFSKIRKAISKAGIIWQSFRESVNQRSVHPSVKTLYEQKYQALGKTLYYLELRKNFEAKVLDFSTLTERKVTRNSSP